jgi:hypothetical protein
MVEHTEINDVTLLQFPAIRDAMTYGFIDGADTISTTNQKTNLRQSYVQTDFGKLR